MKRIKKFHNFTRTINEVSVDNTYLDQVDISKDGVTGPFAQAPRTKGKTWGLEFEKNSGYENYIVVFPDYLVKQIIELVEEKRGNRIGTDILEGIEIETEGESGFNRTHFPGGINNELRGIGLGYIIYEEFIKFLGYASSKYNASGLAQKVWKKISSDPDFLGICYKNGILVFDSKMDDDKILDVAMEYLSRNNFNINFFDEEIEQTLEENNLNIDSKLIEIIKKGKKDFKYKQLLLNLLDDTDKIAWAKKKEIENNKTNGVIQVNSLKDFVSIHTLEYMKTETLPKVEKIKEQAKKENFDFGEKEERVIGKIKDRYNWYLSQVKSDILNGLEKLYNKYTLEKVKEEIKSINDYIELFGIRKEVENHFHAFRYYDLRKKFNETFRTKGYEATLNLYNTYIKEQIKDMKISVNDDYTWCEELVYKYKNEFPELEGVDKKKVNMDVDKHFEIQMRVYKKILFATYEKISKKMEKAYYEGGYDKAKKYFDSIDKNKINQLTFDVVEYVGYGLTSGRAEKLSALKHLTNRLETYRLNPTPPKKDIPEPPPVKKDIPEPPPVKVETPEVPKNKPPQTKSEEPIKTEVPQRTLLRRFQDFLGL